MKKASYFPGLLILILSLIFTSCGAGKKLSRSEAKVDKLQRDSTNIQSQLNDCIEKVKNLNQAKASLQNEYSSLQNEFSAVQNDSKVHSAESKITIADQAKRLKTLTDNIPIKTNLFKDNWDLSTARATSIVRILTIDNGFDPSRITASGRGQFHPVKTNETDDGRSGNRRTDIILSPDLKEIFKILYQ